MSKFKSYTVLVEEDSEGLFITLPPEVLEETGWQSGDNLEWIDNGDGSYTLRKSMKTELVMVECISTFRQRYVVEVPVGKKDWALDTVTCEEAKEFSQLHLGETIISSRVVDVDEVIKICDEDNDYVKNWTKEQKIKNFVTQWHGHIPTLEDEVEHSSHYFDTGRNR